MMVFYWLLLALLGSYLAAWQVGCTELSYFYSWLRALRKPNIKKPGPKFARIALRNGDPLAPRSGEI